MIRYNISAKLLLVLLGIVIPLLTFEIIFAIVTNSKDRDKSKAHSLFVWDEKSPQIYTNNPENLEINHYGYRSCSEPDITHSKPTQTQILFLGDSVTYGYSVPCEEAFPHLVGEALRNDFGDGITVHNSGVSGYNTYTEYQAYLASQKHFNSDIVVLVTVLNDFANPRLHWGIGGNYDLRIPDVAIPNLDYDKDIAIPTLASWRTETSRNRFFTHKLYKKLIRLTSKPETLLRDHNGLPVHVTGESNFSITTLLDIHAVEIVWYRDLLLELKNTIDENNGQLVLAVMPLSYQLETGYPYRPQTVIQSICDSLEIPMIDLLPIFEEAKPVNLFLDHSAEYQDIWHINPAGHQIVAAEIRKSISQFIKPLDR